MSRIQPAYENDRFAYSFVECRNICLQMLVLKKCKCVPTVYPSRAGLKEENCGKYFFTNPELTAEKIACQNGVLNGAESHVNFEEECKCYKPCNDTLYEISLSSSNWPAKHSIKSFLKVILEDHPNRTSLKAYHYYTQLLQKNATFEEVYSWVRNHFFRFVTHVKFVNFMH